MPFAFKVWISYTSVPKFHFYLWHTYVLIGFLCLVVIFFSWLYKLLFIFHFYYFEHSFIECCNYFTYKNLVFLLGAYSFLYTFTNTWILLLKPVHMYVNIFLYIPYCIFFYLWYVKKVLCSTFIDWFAWELKLECKHLMNKLFCSFPLVRKPSDMFSETRPVLRSNAHLLSDMNGFISDWK